MKVMDLILDSTYEWSLKQAVQEIPSTKSLPASMWFNAKLGSAWEQVATRSYLKAKFVGF